MTKKRIFLTQGFTFIIIILIQLSFSILFSSCGLKDKLEVLVQKEENIKENDKRKIDTLKYYYPVSLTEPDKIVSTCDTAMLSTFSGSLLKAHEPVIYTFDNEHDVYRLFIFDAKRTVRIISLNRDKDKVWLSVKELSRPAFLKPQSNGKFVPALNPDGSIDSLKDVSYAEYEAIEESMGKLALVSNFKSRYSETTWDNMEYLINKADFWKMPAYMNMDYRGDEHWILEARVNNKYWLVDKINPGGEFRKCCDYLLELKSLSEKNSSDDWDD